MAFNVNTNLSNSNILKLNHTNEQMQRSFQRLSSDLRINSAKDDAAELAISTRFSSQIKVFNQAVRNANDGISLAQTADSGMMEIKTNLQRMRELAVQSANSNYTDSDRASLNKEYNVLKNEINRISETVSFNGITLFDGSAQNLEISINSSNNKGQSNNNPTISISDIRSENIGAVQIIRVKSDAPTAALKAGDLTINEKSIAETTADDVSYKGADYSAISMANAINKQTNETNIYAEVDGTTVNKKIAAVGAVNLDGTTNSLQINGVNIGAVNVQSNDSNNALQKAINKISAQTGVAASLDSNKNLVLSAADGRNITVTTTGADAGGNSTAKSLGLSSDANLTDDTTAGTYTVKSKGDESIIIGGANPGAAGLQAGTYNSATKEYLNNSNISTAMGAYNAIESINSALNTIDDERMKVSAFSNKLESAERNLQNASDVLLSSRTKITDTDFAAETAKLTKIQILQSAGTAMLSHMNQLPQSVLSLLG